MVVFSSHHFIRRQSDSDLSSKPRSILAQHFGECKRRRGTGGVWASGGRGCGECGPRRVRGDGGQGETAYASARRVFGMSACVLTCAYMLLTRAERRSAIQYCSVAARRVWGTANALAEYAGASTARRPTPTTSPRTPAHNFAKCLKTRRTVVYLLPTHLDKLNSVRVWQRTGITIYSFIEQTQRLLPRIHSRERVTEPLPPPPAGSCMLRAAARRYS